MSNKSDETTLRGRIQALREWDEGFDELKAIPFSFAVEFRDDEGPWSMYADSEEEKVRHAYHGLFRLTYLMFSSR